LSASARVMKDRDLSPPATRQRTSNASRPGLRRIAKTRTSNTFIDDLLELQVRASGDHQTNGRAVRACRPAGPVPGPWKELAPSEGSAWCSFWHELRAGPGAPGALVPGDRAAKAELARQPGKGRRSLQRRRTPLDSTGHAA